MNGLQPPTGIKVEEVPRQFEWPFATRNKTVLIFGPNTCFRISEILSLRIITFTNTAGSLSTFRRVERIRKARRRADYRSPRRGKDRNYHSYYRKLASGYGRVLIQNSQWRKTSYH